MKKIDIPTKDEIRLALWHIPVHWLAKPYESTLPVRAAEPRIAPIVATAIGVAAGAGIQLTGQALSRGIPNTIDLEELLDFECHQTLAQIEDAAIHCIDIAARAKGDDNILAQLTNTSFRNAPKNRPLPVAAAAFLAGVTAGAAAARARKTQYAD